MRKRKIPSYLIDEYLRWLRLRKQPSIAAQEPERRRNAINDIVAEHLVVEALEMLRDEIESAIYKIENEHGCHDCDCDECVRNRCSAETFSVTNIRYARNICVRILMLGLAPYVEIESIPYFDAEWVCDDARSDVYRTLERLDDIERDILMVKCEVV
jgi:hypothetical protein